jgi:phosphatidylinositol dimannoside acyltransferase
VTPSRADPQAAFAIDAAWTGWEPSVAEQIPRISPAAALLAKLPILGRRFALRGLFHLAALTRRGARAGLAAHFERVLRLPRREALRLDREAAFHDALAELEWLALHTRSHAGIRRDLTRVTVRSPDVLAQLAAGGAPVILAPLHMGPYVLGLLKTLLTFFPDRSLLILRRRDDRPMETQVMQRIAEFGIPVRFLTVTDRSGYLPAIRYARQRAVLVVFGDLPPSYGRPASMPILGLPTRFAFGVETLAHLTGATVVPLAITGHGGGAVVTPRNPFTVHGSDAAERARAAELMRRHIEATIRTSPEQWHLWARLHEYLPDAGAQAAEGLAA